MAIDKLTEFSSSNPTTNNNTVGLTLADGFPKSIQPARQWFNWLFNSLTAKINEIIDESASINTDKVSHSDVIDNLISTDTENPLSANMGRVLNEKKLEKTDLASGDAPVFACRAWGDIDGTTRTLRQGGNVASVSFDSNANCTVTFSVAMPHANYSLVTCCTARGDSSQIGIISKSTTGFVVRGNYGGDNTVGSFIPDTLTFSIFC